MTPLMGQAPTFKFFKQEGAVSCEPAGSQLLSAQTNSHTEVAQLGEACAEPLHNLLPNQTHETLLRKARLLPVISMLDASAQGDLESPELTALAPPPAWAPHMLLPFPGGLGVSKLC